MAVSTGGDEHGTGARRAHDPAGGGDRRGGVPGLPPVRAAARARRRGRLPGQLPHRVPANVVHLLEHPGFRLLRCDVTDYVHVPGTGRPGAALRLAGQPARLPADADRDAQGRHRSAPCTRSGWRKEKGARFVLASTSEVYGDPLVHPQTERRTGATSTRSGRAGSTTRPSGSRGDHDGVPHVARASTPASCGSSTPTGRGCARTTAARSPRSSARRWPASRSRWPATARQTRSICYVDDTVDGHPGGMACVRPRRAGEHRQPRRAVDAASWPSWIIELTGSSSPIEFIDLPVDDPKVRRPDTTRAEQLLGWRPQVELGGRAAAHGGLVRGLGRCTGGAGGLTLIALCAPSMGAAVTGGRAHPGPREQRASMGRHVDTSSPARRAVTPRLPGRGRRRPPRRRRCGGLAGRRQPRSMAGAAPPGLSQHRHRPGHRRPRAGACRGKLLGRSAAGSDGCLRPRAVVTAQQPLQTVGQPRRAARAGALPAGVGARQLDVAGAGGRRTRRSAVGPRRRSPVVLATSRAAADQLRLDDHAADLGPGARQGTPPLAVPDLAASAEGLAALGAVRASLGGGADADNAVVQAVLAAGRAGRSPRPPTRCAARARRRRRPARAGERAGGVARRPRRGRRLAGRGLPERRARPSLDYPVLRVGRASGDPRRAVDAVVGALTSPDRARPRSAPPGSATPPASPPTGAGRRRGAGHRPGAAAAGRPRTVQALLQPADQPGQAVPAAHRHRRLDLDGRARSGQRHPGDASPATR